MKVNKLFYNQLHEISLLSLYKVSMEDEGIDGTSDEEYSVLKEWKEDLLEDTTEQNE